MAVICSLMVAFRFVSVMLEVMLFAVYFFKNYLSCYFIIEFRVLKKQINRYCLLLPAF